MCCLLLFAVFDCFPFRRWKGEKKKARTRPCCKRIERIELVCVRVGEYINIYIPYIYILIYILYKRIARIELICVCCGIYIYIYYIYIPVYIIHKYIINLPGCELPQLLVSTSIHRSRMDSGAPLQNK